MHNIQLRLAENKHGAFYSMEGTEQLGEMVIGIAGQHLTVYHTEVSPKAEGTGLAKELLTSAVDYARKNALMIVPLCPYVLAQFRRHPDQYNDVWFKDTQHQA